MCEVDGTIRETMAARDSEKGIVMSNAAEHVLMFRYSDVLLTWPAGGNFKRPALPKRKRFFPALLRSCVFCSGADPS